MASSSMSVQTQTREVVDQCPFFGGDISDWWALRPTERAEVILAAYQERVLPELGRLERLITRLVVEFGLEYRGLEELAVFFLEVAREVRDHIQVLESSVAVLANNRATCDLETDTADMSELIVRFRTNTERCATDGETSTCYARLVDGFRKCQLELAELLILEADVAR